LVLVQTAAVLHSAAAPQIKENQKAKGKNLCAGPRAGLGRNLQGLAAIKTIVNDSILERRRKLATSRNLRSARRNGTLVVQSFPLEHGGLLPQGKDLKRSVMPAAEEDPGGGKQSKDEFEHELHAATWCDGTPRGRLIVLARR